MLKPRIIPTLLIHNKGLVKTVGFKSPKYVGDPINAVRIFNELAVDELMVLDIDASRHNCEPNFKLISDLARECRMPFCYGGGVKTVDQVKSILRLGVEKVSISEGAILNPQLISEAASEVGSQSVVVTIDVKKKRVGKGYEIYTCNGMKKSKHKLLDYVVLAQEKGAGEIVVNSIDFDGQMTGYHIDLISMIKPHVSVPLTVLGGAGSYSDISNLVDTFNIIGCAAGSLFVFNGKYRAVLISYPNREQKCEILSSSSVRSDVVVQ